MILYVKTGCPYCAKVLRCVEENGVVCELRNIADEGVSDELIAHGGKHQVPYLVDDEVSMYESDDIIAYLEKKLGKEAVEEPKIRIHRSEDACCD